MALISVNIPPPSLGDLVKPHELLVKSFGKEQKKMEENAPSSPSNHSDIMQLFTDMHLERSDYLLEVPSECKIYRVHEHLRNINDKAYEPEVIAIGPYHRDKDSLKMMEYHKKRYFNLICAHKSENFVKYYSAIRALEQVARNCYADPISLNETEFIKMLILDGCFIIEFARKIDRDEYDPITRMAWMIYSVKRDLMLFENQIPFFVLCKLFDLIEGTNQHGRLIGLLTRIFRDIHPGEKNKESSKRSPDEDRESSIGLLTRFLRNYICHEKEDRKNSNRSPDEDIENSNRRLDEDIESSNRSPNEIKHLLHLIHIDLVSSFESDLAKCAKYERKQLRFIKSATWLKNANVKFKRNAGARSLFDIKFKRGTLLLPPLRIEDRTESSLRNLIAYEQYFHYTRNSYVTNYVLFIDHLINFSGDAEILSRLEIIDNWLGDDESVAQIFNKLTDSVVIWDADFIYGEIFDKVEEHCSKRWNRWMANLKRTYFNSPWAIISVIAAVVLLLLTFAQTLFSGLSLK